MTYRLLTQAEQWPDRVAEVEREEQLLREALALPQNALESGEFFHNRDPEFAKSVSEGTTVPHFVGGDPAGEVSIEPHETADSHDAFVMHVPEEEGEGYDAIVRRSPRGHGYDVLKEL